MKMHNSYLHLFLIICLITTLIPSTVVTEIKALKQQNPTGISHVNFMANIHLQFVTLNITIEYIQLKENPQPFVDKVYLWGNISHVVVEDKWKNNLLISNFYNETSGFSEITLRLPKILNVGERYTVYITTITPTHTDQSSHYCELKIQFSQTVSVFSAIAILDKKLILYSAYPKPQSITTIDQRIQMNWDTIMLDYFELVIHFGYTVSNQDITIFPEAWYIGRIPRNEEPLSQSFKITNLLNKTILITITSNVSEVKTPEQLIIKPYGEILANVSLDISHSGVIQGAIFFTTNTSQQQVICPVYANIYVKNDNTAIIVALSITTTVLAILNFYQYYRRKKKAAQQPKIVERTEKKELNLNIEDWKSFFNEREYTVIKYVAENQGISQQQVALQTGIPKATVSRIIAKLEKKGIITKKSVGMSNKLYINTESPIFNKKQKS